jgi:DNA polymerase III alpha subunit (gram-positive type)
MRNSVWVAGLALAFGCAMGKSEETKKSETRTVQDQAHQSLQQAANAQKRAADEQAKVEKLQQEVTQKQKDLADAQARLKAQIAKAEQAQRDAQEATRVAQQEAQQQQQLASQTQRAETQQMQSTNQERLQTWTQEKTVSGRVLQADGNRLEVRTPDQNVVQLQVTDATAVRVNGQSASLSQIQPGSDIRASYQVVDGQAKALTVDATSTASGR